MTWIGHLEMDIVTSKGSSGNQLILRTNTCSQSNAISLFNTVQTIPNWSEKYKLLNERSSEAY